MDGVCNRFDKYGLLQTMPHVGLIHPYRLELNVVKAIDHVMRQTSAVKLVISSTWRLPDTPFATSRRDFARYLGVSPSIIHPDWRTPLIGDGSDRGAEVAAWLENHPEVVKSVVIDDDYQGQFKKIDNLKVMRTDPKIGLTFIQLQKSMQYLGFAVKGDYTLVSAGGPKII